MALRRTSERGAALLVVMVAVAVLTILAVQLAYDTRVSLQIAVNARDDLRATYLAKSGVNLSRLVLSFQQRIDQMSGSAPSQVASGSAMPRIQLWRLVPVGSGFASGLFGGGAAAQGEVRPAATSAGEAASGATGKAPSGGEPAGATPARAQTTAEGFQATIDDEGRKVTAQLDVLGATGFLSAQVQSLYELICDPRWDPLFDREDTNGVRITRQDLLVYLRDWLDPDERGSALVASFPSGGGCSIVVPPNPFEDGFQDENYAYDRGPDRYRTKNAPMDSLDELYMLAGIGDAFMAAFGNDLTVYGDARRNVNETERAGLLRLAAYVADPAALTLLQDPKLGELLQTEVVKRTFNGMLAMTPADFGEILKFLGVAVNPTRINSLTDRSTAFGIKSQGKAGAVLKVLDAVVQLEDTQQPNSPVPGKLVHWHEE